MRIELISEQIRNITLSIVSMVQRTQLSFILMALHVFGVLQSRLECA